MRAAGRAGPKILFDRNARVSRCCKIYKTRSTQESIDREANVDRAPAAAQRASSRSMDRSYGRCVIQRALRDLARRDVCPGGEQGCVFCRSDPRLALHGQPALRAASRFLWERSIDREANVDRVPSAAQRASSRSMDRSYGRGGFWLGRGFGVGFCRSGPRLALHGQPALRAASRFLWERSIDREADVDRVPEHAQRAGSRSMDRSYGRCVILAWSRVRGWFLQERPTAGLAWPAGSAGGEPPVFVGAIH
jgi:hypothetical protein